MNKQNVRVITALITVVSILTLFCGSIFACLLPTIDAKGGMTANCPANKDQKGEEGRSPCAISEFAHAQNSIKLPQDIKEIRAVTFINQDQIFHSDQTSLMQVYTNLIERVYIPDKVEIFRKDLSLRL